jgi:hypothetical protein
MEREITIPQGPSREPPSMIKTLTPEYLDSIINNHLENPDTREQAFKMKERLFPATTQKVDITEKDFINPSPVVVAEEVKPKTKEKRAKKQKALDVQPSPSHIMPISQVANKSEFDSLISEFKNNLFNDEFILLSNEHKKIQLRSMTVAEYKFLAKQMEIYQKTLISIDRTNPESSRELDLRESILTNAIDTVIQRCITNDINVYELSYFDWIYSLLALKAVSRGADDNLKIKCQNAQCGADVSLGVGKVLKTILSKKSEITSNLIKIVRLTDDTELYLSVPLRKNLFEAQKIFVNDPDSSLAFINSAMYIQAYIKNGVANILNESQRMELYNVLPYEKVKEIEVAISESLLKFYKCFGEFKCEKCEAMTEIDVSDFILFFYDF